MISRLSGVSKSYLRGSRSFEVFHDFNLSIKERELFILSGHSGSGKSTMLALLGGYLKADCGEVLFEDKNLSHMSDDELSVLHSEEIGYLPQSNVMVSELTILENVILKFLLSKDTDKRPEAMKLLEMLGIDKLADRYPCELSGGELRRAAIARLLLGRPKLYLLDEPSGGLDKECIHLVMNCLKRCTQEGSTVVVATHDDLVKEYATGMLELDAR